MLLLSMVMLLLAQQCEGKPLDVSARIAMLLSDNISSSLKDKAEAIDTILQLLAEIDLPAICEAVMMEKPDRVTQMDNIIAAAAQEQGFDSMMPAHLQTTENNIVPAKFPIKGINALPANFPMKMTKMLKTENDKTDLSDKVLIKSVEADRANISLSAEARRLESQRLPELDRPELVGFKLAPSEHYMQQLEGQNERDVGVVGGIAEAVQSMEEGVTFRTSPSVSTSTASTNETSGTNSTVDGSEESNENITATTTERPATSTAKLSTQTSTPTESTEGETTVDILTSTSSTEYLVETTTSDEIIEDIVETTAAPIVNIAAVEKNVVIKNKTEEDEVVETESSGETEEITITPTVSDSFVKNAMEKINEYINSLNMTSTQNTTTQVKLTETNETAQDNMIIRDVNVSAVEVQNVTVPLVNTTEYIGQGTEADLENMDNTTTINTTEAKSTAGNSTFRLYQTGSQSSSTTESTTAEQTTESISNTSTTTVSDMTNSTTLESTTEDLIRNDSITTSLPLSSINESTTMPSTSTVAEFTKYDADTANSTAYEANGLETANNTDVYQEAETTQTERDSTTLDYFWTPGKTMSVSDAIYEYDDATDDHSTTSFHVSTESENVPESKPDITETSNSTKNETAELTTEFVPEVSTESATSAPNAPNEYDYVYNMVDLNTDQKQENNYDRYDNTAYGGYDINNIDYPQAATEYVLDPLKTSPHLLHNIYNDATYVGTKQDTYGLDTKQETYGVDTKQGTYGVDTKQGTYGVDTKQGTYGVDTKHDIYNLGTKQHEVNTYAHKDDGVNMLASIDSPANTGAEEDFMLSAQPGYFNSLADQSSWGLHGKPLKHHTLSYNKGYDKSYDKLFTAHTQTKESSTNGLASAMGVQQKTVWEEPTLPQIFFQPNGYSCPGLFGYYADISDCQAFFICSWGVPYRFVCPRGTLWSSSQTVCDWSSNVICSNKK